MPLLRIPKRVYSAGDELSASAMVADHEAARRAGFDGFLNKPISVRSLPAQVESYLAAGRS